MLNINNLFKYSALLILLLSFILELYIVGIENRGGILTVQYGVLFGFFTLMFVFGKVYFSPFFKRILLFLLLLSFLGLFSSDLVITYNYLAKFTSGLLFFAVGYSYFKGARDLKLLIHFSMVMLAVGLVIVFYNNYTGSGISLYKNDFFGQSKSNTYNVFSILIALLISQLAALNKWQKAITLLLFFFSLLMLLMVFKRTPFLIIFSSVLVLVYFNSTRRNFKRIISALAILAILFIYTYPYYEAQLNKNLLSRQGSFEEDLTEEGRYKENFVVIAKISQEPLSLLVGTREVFNSRGKSFLDDRMLHNDYANILWSSGLVGFALFFGNILYLLLNFWQKRKLLAPDAYLKNAATSGIIIVLCYILCAMAQAWTSITILGVIMLFSGYCLRAITINRACVS